jgi:peptidoglycan/xylan/chitin deacetylase (PgdA/CDA1 family)
MNPGRSSILTYHSVDASGSVISISPRSFRGQMAWLAQAGIPVVPLDKIRTTPGGVALTFDDGFRNFFEHAFPILQEFRFPATVFVVSQYCGARNNWPSQPSSPPVPRLDLMSWSELEEVSKAEICLGSHTATHPFLSRLSEREVEDELRVSRASLEDRTAKAVDTFAYPYGDSTPAVRLSVARHYRLACGTKLAFLSAGSDVFELPRLDVYYFQKRFWFEGLSSLYGAVYVAARGALRSLRGRLVRLEAR